MLIGMRRYADAATAIRLAGQRDPANSRLAAILPVIDQVAAAEPAARWTTERAEAVRAHLQSVGATRELVALSGEFQLRV